jgi:hypothetical protein
LPSAESLGLNEHNLAIVARWRAQLAVFFRSVALVRTRESVELPAHLTSLAVAGSYQHAQALLGVNAQQQHTQQQQQQQQAQTSSSSSASSSSSSSASQLSRQLASLPPCACAARAATAAAAGGAPQLLRSSSSSSAAVTPCSCYALTPQPLIVAGLENGPFRSVPSVFVRACVHARMHTCTLACLARCLARSLACFANC